MHFIGGDHYNNRIPHDDLQIFCHRVYAKIEWYLPDIDLRHKLNTDVFKTTGADNDFYTRDDTSLKNFLIDCKAKNIVPIVCNNATYLDPEIPVAEYARRSKIIDQLIYDVGFDLAYNSHMNEPGKRHDTQEYTTYTNAAVDKIKHYDSIMGNDEYNMLDWNYLLDNCKAHILGVHPLSSLGYPPNWQILNDWATMATARGKPYMITEGGSWFKKYDSLEGYTVIKNLILRAKALGYLATCIVTLDMNAVSYPKLGFNRFNKSYSILQDTSEYWEDNDGDNFINLVNREGSKYEQPEIKGVKDGMIIKTIGHKTDDVKSGYGVELLHELLINRGYIEDDDIESMFVYDTKTRAAVESFQTDLGIAKDGRVGRQGWRNFISAIPEADIKKDFQFNLEVVMSPYNLEGDT